jgi:DNA-directed RNA polymerase alpha subunit
MEQKLLKSILQEVISGIKEAQNSVRIPGATVIPEDTTLYIHFEANGHSYIRASVNIPVKISATREPDAAELHPQAEILNTKIWDTNLPTRIKHALSSRRIETVRDMVNLPDAKELLSCRSIGHKSVSQAENFLADHNLSFGMFNQ